MNVILLIFLSALLALVTIIFVPYSSILRNVSTWARGGLGNLVFSGWVEVIPISLFGRARKAMSKDKEDEEDEEDEEYEEYDEYDEDLKLAVRRYFAKRKRLIFVQKSGANAAKEPEDQHPPQFAEYLLYVFLTKKERVSLLGDLEEDYHTVYSKFGKRKAQLWYYAQVIRSLWPFIVRPVKKFITWGVVGWVSNFVRRLIP